MEQLRQSNRLGIQLGGVWQDFHDRIRQAEESRAAAEESLLKMTVERDRLQSEKDYLMYKFRENVASLTDSETNHLEAKQIIDTIRQEKQDLVHKCLSLETQRDWLEDQNKILKATNLRQDDSLTAAMTRIQELETKLAEEVKESKTLNELVFKRDERIEAVQKLVKVKEEELDVLNKSLSTRDRQWHTLLKERNRLKDDVAHFEKIVHNFNGLSTNKQQQHHIQLRGGDVSKRVSASTASRRQPSVFVTPDKNVRFSERETPSSEDVVTSNEATPSSDANNDEVSDDPYLAMFEGLTTSVPPPPSPPSAPASAPVKEVRSQTVNQFLSSTKSSGMKEKLSESLLSRYKDQLESARCEIERLEAVAEARVQQRRIVVNAEELRKHQRITSPAYHMTRRSKSESVSATTSPTAIVVNHSGQKPARFV